jgi:hypothetical protein
MRDGLNLHFIHRSFQEYFSAVYLLRYRGGAALSLYDRLFHALNVNDVALMAYDMDILAFEREWALPACARLKNELDLVDDKIRHLRLLQITWYTLVIEENDKRFSSFSWLNGKIFHESLAQLSKVYSSVFPNLMLQFAGEVSDGEGVRALLERYIDDSAVRRIYDKDDDVHDGLDEIEFSIEKYPIDWIDETSMAHQLKSCVNAIYELHEYLTSRVARRETIDLLN